MSTQIVDIPEEHLYELTQWVHNHSGSIRPWNLVTGQYGTLYTDQDQPSLNLYLRMKVALNTPEMRCPTVVEMPDHVKSDLLQIAADSYQWMHEGHCDEIDLPDLMSAISEVLTPRQPMSIPDRDLLVQQLRRNLADGLPDWPELSSAQRAVIEEAVIDSLEWANDRRLDEYTESLLLRSLRETQWARAA